MPDGADEDIKSSTQRLKRRRNPMIRGLLVSGSKNLELLGRVEIVKVNTKVKV